jgi:predicted nucleotide-binding protein (sugar kinase/HSP70/actin superfamily)
MGWWAHAERETCLCPLDITDAWKNSYSRTNHKVWAAEFTARHPNLVAPEISTFKCGHGAPIYGVVEGIIEQSRRHISCFKDLDENKPSGSIKIRVETIDYFWRRYREEVIRKRKAMEDIDAQLAALEAELRGSMTPGPTQPEREVQETSAD